MNIFNCHFHCSHCQLESTSADTFKILISLSDKINLARFDKVSLYVKTLVDSPNH